jgi:hypothetical protein
MAEWKRLRGGNMFAEADEVDLLRAMLTEMERTQEERLEVQPGGLPPAVYAIDDHNTDISSLTSKTASPLDNAPAPSYACFQAPTSSLLSPRGATHIPSKVATADPDSYNAKLNMEGFSGVASRALIANLGDDPICQQPRADGSASTTNATGGGGDDSKRGIDSY